MSAWTWRYGSSGQAERWIAVREAV
jgi:hypothetical protein